MTLSPIRRRQCAVGAIALATTLMAVQPAFASANVEGLLQNVVDMLTGNTARLLAILAVVIVGILWMFVICRGKTFGPCCTCSSISSSRCARPMVGSG